MKKHKTDLELLDELNKKLDVLVIASCIGNLSGAERLSLLKYSVGIKPAARILSRDKSSLKIKLKGEKVKNAKKE